MRMCYFKWSNFGRLHSSFFSLLEVMPKFQFICRLGAPAVNHTTSNILLLYVHILLLLSSNLGLATEADRHFFFLSMQRS